ncbi:MAG: hypothetical protein Q8O67_21630 [Deltaproteobacteria bacterium]|nr:hypothetical protein [Deltaproteobacteria bacterium]
MTTRICRSTRPRSQPGLSLPSQKSKIEIAVVRISFYAIAVRLDLHRHLEGSHSPAALAAVAEQFGINDPVFFDVVEQRYRTGEELRSALTLSGPSDDAQLFYRCIIKARAAYTSEAAIAELARRAFVEAATETHGFEMRVSLFSMTRTLLDHEQVEWRTLAPVAFAERARRLLLLVLRARDEAAASERKPILLRVGFSRTFESEEHYRALAEVVREHRAAICGLDVLGIVIGPDREPMPAALRAILASLRKDVPDLTIHAGEFEGHDSVERTLELDPQAIGHGVRSIESDATLARLAREGVTLEVCTTSNRLLIPTVLRTLEHRCGGTPLRALQQAHVHCVLGSDDPTPMGTTFAHEYELAATLGADMKLLAQDTARRWHQLRSPTA